MKYTGNMPGLLESIIFLFPSDLPIEALAKIRAHCFVKIVFDYKEVASLPLCDFPCRKWPNGQRHLEVHCNLSIPPETEVSAALFTDDPTVYPETGITIRVELAVLYAVKVEPDLESRKGLVN